MCRRRESPSERMNFEQVIHAASDAYAEFMRADLWLSNLNPSF